MGDKSTGNWINKIWRKGSMKPRGSRKFKLIAFEIEKKSELHWPVKIEKSVLRKLDIIRNRFFGTNYNFFTEIGFCNLTHLNMFEKWKSWNLTNQEDFEILEKILQEVKFSNMTSSHWLQWALKYLMT